MNSLNRRGFLRTAGALGVGSLFSRSAEAAGLSQGVQGAGPSRPVVISSPNGLPATERAMAMIVAKIRTPTTNAMSEAGRRSGNSSVITLTMMLPATKAIAVAE